MSPAGRVRAAGFHEPAPPRQRGVPTHRAAGQAWAETHARARAHRERDRVFEGGTVRSNDSRLPSDGHMLALWRALQTSTAPDLASCLPRQQMPVCCGTLCYRSLPPSSRKDRKRTKEMNFIAPFSFPVFTGRGSEPAVCDSCCLKRGREDEFYSL